MKHLKLLTVSSSGELNFVHKSIKIPVFNINVKNRTKYSSIKSDKFFAKEIEIKHEQRKIMNDLIAYCRKTRYQAYIKQRDAMIALIVSFVEERINESEQRELKDKTQLLAEKYSKNN